MKCNISTHLYCFNGTCIDQLRSTVYNHKQESLDQISPSLSTVWFLVWKKEEIEFNWHLIKCIVKIHLFFFFNSSILYIHNGLYNLRHNTCTCIRTIVKFNRYWILKSIYMNTYYNINYVATLAIPLSINSTLTITHIFCSNIF